MSGLSLGRCTTHLAAGRHSQRHRGLSPYLGWADPLFAFLISLGLVCCARRGEEDDACARALRASVACLDTATSVYSPVVLEIARLGEPAIPLVVDKIESKRRMTAGAAVYVLKHMASEAAIQPLIDAWDKGKASEALRAVAMILQERPDFCRASPVEGVDQDRKAVFQALMRWAVLGRTLPGAQEWQRFPTSYHVHEEYPKKDVVVLSTDELNLDYTFDLPGKEVRVLNEQQQQEWADMYGDYLCLRFRDVRVYEPSSRYVRAGTVRQSHEIGHGKAAFDALAVLWLDMRWKKSKDSSIAYLGGGGAQTFWRERKGEWRAEAILGAWMS